MRLHFERELPTYAEPVNADKLAIGETYFAVQYLDEDLLLPTVETLILTEKKQGEDGKTVFCFQDRRSYRAGIRRGSAEAGCAISYSQPEQYLNHIFEYEYAVDELIRCVLRRRKKSDSTSK
jgi:hypothetical protein